VCRNTLHHSCFFCSRWDLRVILYIAVRPGCEMSTHYFSCLGETATDSTKRCQDTLRRTCVFASSDLCGSCSAFRCLWGMKHHALFFMLGWDWCGFHKKCIRRSYFKLVFSHLVGYAGRVVPSGVRNINTLYFIIVWNQYLFQKKRAGTCYAELMFLNPVGSAGHVVHCGASGA
jgi:hypothetical protein